MDLVVDANGIYARAFYALHKGKGVDSGFEQLDDLNESRCDEVYRIVHSGIVDFILGGSRYCPIPRPDRVSIVWDGEHRRDKGRIKPPEYYEYLAYTRNALKESLGAVHFISPGEADDAIASTVALSQRGNHDVIVVSSDKDICQTINEHCLVYSPSAERILDAAYVEQRWGVHNPSHLAVYLAICGDAVDKISGIHGIGPKGFKKLYAGIDGKAAVGDVFNVICDRLTEDQANQFAEMLNLTLLDYGLEVPEPERPRLHPTTARRCQARRCQESE